MIQIMIIIFSTIISSMPLFMTWINLNQSYHHNYHYSLWPELIWITHNIIIIIMIWINLNESYHSNIIISTCRRVSLAQSNSVPNDTGYIGRCSRKWNLITMTMIIMMIVTIMMIMIIPDYEDYYDYGYYGDYDYYYDYDQHQLHTVFNISLLTILYLLF